MVNNYCCLFRILLAINVLVMKKWTLIMTEECDIIEDINYTKDG